MIQSRDTLAWTMKSASHSPNSSFRGATTTRPQPSSKGRTSQLPLPKSFAAKTLRFKPALVDKLSLLIAAVVELRSKGLEELIALDNRAGAILAKHIFGFLTPLLTPEDKENAIAMLRITMMAHGLAWNTLLKDPLETITSLNNKIVETLAARANEATADTTA